MDPALALLAAEVEEQITPVLEGIRRRSFSWTSRILQGFAACGLQESDLWGKSGYGYGDRGRAVLEAVYTQLFKSEAALVRPQIVSGTHALVLAARAAVPVGKELLCAAPPYETLQTAFDLHGEVGQFEGRTVRIVGKANATLPTPQEIATAVGPQTAALMLQRSRGYQLHRGVMTNARLNTYLQAIRAAGVQVPILVDNCYGEFVEEEEPTALGADLVAGSLIKNPGGGIALTGGYLAGRKMLVQAAASSLIAPGLDGEVGPTAPLLRGMLLGLFLAPQMVAHALSGAVFLAALFEKLGFPVSPQWKEPRGDIVQSVTLGSRERLLAFCRAVQAHSPIDANALPEPGRLAGYDSPVVMAAGNFVQGGSLELSADAPLQSPYTVFWQGGLSEGQTRIAALAAAAAVTTL
ncbi:MAG: methionine gamma-lyase family protein [Firmicutes bacterium]|nr:methionine gamma-lyase family protein [Bacillota bacterium]